MGCSRSPKKLLKVKLRMPESQWTPDERRVVVQDQRLKSIIMSCLPDDIMESVISCVSVKETWTEMFTTIRIFQEDLYDEDEKEVSDEEEVTQVKVPMALADDELTVGNSLTRNGEWVDITIRTVNTLLFMDEDAYWQNYLKDELLILKQAKLDAITFQIQNTKLTKLNHALQEQLKEEKKINEKWLTSSKKVSQCISEQIPHQKKKVLGGELLTESSSKNNENENLFIPTFMGYDQEMVPKTKDWVEILNPDSKLPNFNTGRILVPKIQAVNESLETSNTLESSKDFEAEFLTPLPPLKILQGASPSLETHQGAHLVPRQWMLKEYDWCQELSAHICRAT
ncbi:hypothetical protein Tco_0599364, partial [Tanacetum coccineum]